MSEKKEMTRYAFISHMEDYLKKLLSDPLKADTDDFLKSYDIDGPKALEILTKRSNPDDETSAVVIKSASIKDNGFNEDGKKNKDTFVVKYKIPRKDYTRKMRDLYINLFESNIIDGSPINEEGDASASGQFTAPAFGPVMRRTLFITEEQAEYLKEATAGDSSFMYTAPMSKGREHDKFYSEAMDHKDIIEKGIPKQ